MGCAAERTQCGPVGCLPACLQGLLSTMAICVMWEVSLLVQILLSMTTGVSGSALAADPLSALSAPLVGTSSLSEQL